MSVTIAAEDFGLTHGGQWALCVAVRDADGQLVSQAPVATVTDPAGVDHAVVLAEVTTGVYAGEYVTAAAGRHTAAAVTADYGTGYAATYVAPTPNAAGFPDVDEVTGYLGPTSATDGDKQLALDAEAAAQRTVCRVPASYPADLRNALLRRVARNLAMKGIPLAVLQADAEGGSATVLPGNDPEVRRFEKPWRRLKMG